MQNHWQLSLTGCKNTGKKLVDIRQRLTKVANELGPMLSGVSAAELQALSMMRSPPLLKHLVLMPFTPDHS